MAPNSVASRVRFIQKLSPRLWATILLLTFFISRPKRNLATLTAIFRRLFGIGTVTLTSAQKTVLLKLKLSSSTKENVSLRELVEGIISPVRLNPLMFNGHVQTMAVATGKGGADPHIYYKRKEWESDSKFYPGHFTTDFVVPTPKKPTPRDRNLPPRTHDFTDEDWTDFISSDNNKPLVILMHGFMGGSHEKYIRHALDDLTAGGKGTELSAVVVNARGCSYSRLTSGTLYHPRATWDIRQFVRWAKKQWPQRKLFAVGFSVGANMLCNYLGEEGDACELDAAVLIGNPWSLDINNAILCQSILGRELYQRSLGTSFKKGFERHIKLISQNTTIDLEKARASRYLWEWDRHVQCPTWGYPSEGAYYRDTSSSDAVLGIKIPVLALHAKNDPVCSDYAVPYDLIEVNPHVVLCATSNGGHLGWIEYGGGRWSNTMVLAFFRKLLADTDGVVPQPSIKTETVVVDGREHKFPHYDPIRQRIRWTQSEEVARVSNS